MISNLRSQNGFTLFETIISVGLLLIIVGSLGGFVVSLQNARSQIASTQEVDANLRMTLDVIGERIRRAQSVDTGTSTFDADPGILSLAMADPAVDPTVFRLNQDNGILEMQEGASIPVAITSSEVSVSNLIFSLQSPSGEPETIGIALTIESASSSDSYASFTHTAATSVTVRLQ